MDDGGVANERISPHGEQVPIVLQENVIEVVPSQKPQGPQVP